MPSQLEYHSCEEKCVTKRAYHHVTYQNAMLSTMGVASYKL